MNNGYPIMSGDAIGTLYRNITSQQVARALHSLLSCSSVAYPSQTSRLSTFLPATEDEEELCVCAIDL